MRVTSTIYLFTNIQPMGYGNQNTDGNKKSNFQWQYGMIKVLNKILKAIEGVPPTKPNKEARTLRVSLSGTYDIDDSCGASFFNASNVTARVQGTDLLPGESVTFSADAEGLLDKIEYEPDPAGNNAGDMFISYVVVVP